MPVGRYVTYKCKKCGYKFTKFIGDVVFPGDIDVHCPKCGGEVEVVSTSLSPTATFGDLIESAKKIFKRKKQ